jgi:putative addiction module component (TIGR02574 family)
VSAAEILEQIRKLNPDDRRELAEQVWSEFGDGLEEADKDLSPAQIAEFEKRAEGLRRHPDRGIPWEKVRAELNDRLEKGRPCPEK